MLLLLRAEREAAAASRPTGQVKASVRGRLV
jgi:hypothetical protein